MAQENKSQLEHNLNLIGSIDENMLKSVINGLNEIEDMGDVKVLNIFISSQGGSLHDCFAMIDVIEYLKDRFNFEINTFGLGLVASGGFFLFLLGDNRCSFPSCRFYVHEHVCVDEEELPYSKKIMREKEDKVLNKMYVHYVARRLNISDQKARALLRKDAWLTAKDLAKYGVVNGELKPDVE